MTYTNIHKMKEQVLCNFNWPMNRLAAVTWHDMSKDDPFLKQLQEWVTSEAVVTDLMCH